MCAGKRAFIIWGIPSGDKLICVAGIEGNNMVGVDGKIVGRRVVEDDVDFAPPLMSGQVCTIYSGWRAWVGMTEVAPPLVPKA